MSERVTSMKVGSASSAGNGGCGVVLLQEMRLGGHSLRIERNEIGQHLYYVDNVAVAVNRYLEIVSTAMHNRPHRVIFRLTTGDPSLRPFGCRSSFRYLDASRVAR